MAESRLQPSSSTAGFFQTFPVLPPRYSASSGLPNANDSEWNNHKRLSDDAVFARILSIYLPGNAGPAMRSIHDFSRRAIHPSVLSHSVDAEINQPVLRPLNTFGDENRSDSLWTTGGWKALKAIGVEEGLVSTAYTPGPVSWNRRVHQFGKVHVWATTSVVTLCPMSMTDGAATLLSKHLKDDDGDQPGRGKVLAEAFNRLTSNEPDRAWTSGQWMTERSGGSDVSGTETVARKLTREELALDTESHRDCDANGMPLGPWRVDGFKWFSSATDSNMAMLLARTEKGISMFYAPTRRRIGSSSESTASELNGVRIQRLKNKVGTKALPTAELELRGMRAWLIGEEGKGVREIAGLINITRMHNAVRNAGYWSHGLAVCRAYSKVRKVRGGLLQDNAQHLRWMAGETVKYWGAVHLAYFGVALLGADQQGWATGVQGTHAQALIPDDPVAITALLRLLTPLAKGQVCLKSVSGIRACMESLGGVGYCENNENGGTLNLARVWRDSAVGSIWEGTTSVMAEDVVRVLMDKRLGHGNVLENVLRPWVQNVLSRCQEMFPEQCATVSERWNFFTASITGVDKETLHWRGREILEHLDVVMTACLLLYDASLDADDVAIAVATRWVRTEVSLSPRLDRGESDLQQEQYMDRKIFLGPVKNVSSSGSPKL
ncbi:hypothetical protein AYO21_02257 [Fonsecaea monophora]|uniref:Acyl-CoA dehydrogenase/oxidase C-terminal domain-containing protein n=1 Tax=Fonsecaea monophora TaxID=254056 RepID=A0A177FIT1_9EURO|nr:hypothetical protein AYO21_02257 [Fonsecaea monophora]KAH0843980.1 aidB [Fonsecaea pedrosoi]OAG43671.1 hypothetical protein AYO21_02257 [Fonsecaea monophora]